MDHWYRGGNAREMVKHCLTAETGWSREIFADHVFQIGPK